MTRASWLGLMAGLFVAAAAACSGGGGPRLTKVFAAPPWSGEERLVYQLRQRDYIRGTCTLETHPAPDQGRTELTSACSSPDGLYRDERAAVADSLTLRPLSSRRVITDAVKGTRTTYAAEYGDGTVTLKRDAEGKTNETTRDLPAPGKESPEPGYYDDESLSWLVRGIPLTAGYEGAYRNVNSGVARAFTATLKVEKTEMVRVPAGEFLTWRIRLKTESITQYFWVEAAAPHRMIRARIERDNYELLPDAGP